MRNCVWETGRTLFQKLWSRFEHVVVKWCVNSCGREGILLFMFPGWQLVQFGWPTVTWAGITRCFLVMTFSFLTPRTEQRKSASISLRKQWACVWVFYCAFCLPFWNIVCMETCVGRLCCFSNTPDSCQKGLVYYLNQVLTGKPQCVTLVSKTTVLTQCKKKKVLEREFT